VLEVLASVVQVSPGKDGKYRFRISDRQIAAYLKRRGQHKALLLLNIQPGRSEFIIEAEAYEKWLREPDVGVALDPEWAMDKGRGRAPRTGHTTGAELDRTARYLSRLVKRHNLPEKVMVYHQVAASVVRRESALKPIPAWRRSSRWTASARPGPKINTYRVVNRTTPKHVHPGSQAVLHRGPSWKDRAVDDAAGGAGAQAAPGVRHVRVACPDSTLVPFATQTRRVSFRLEQVRLQTHSGRLADQVVLGDEGVAGADFAGAQPHIAPVEP
jgi:hypothetical protein